MHEIFSYICLVLLLLSSIQNTYSAEITRHVSTSSQIVVHVTTREGERVWAGASIKKRDGTIVDLDAKPVTGQGVQVMWMTPRGAEQVRISLWREKKKCNFFGKCEQCKISNRNYHMEVRLADTQWQNIGNVGF